MNLYEQQSANRRKTWLVMFVFVAFLFVLGLGFDAFYLGQAGGAVPVGSVLALGVGSVSALAGFFNGDRAVLLATGAKPIALVAATASEADKLKLRQLDNVVDEMAIAAGLPRPPVYVVTDPDPNAFATGRGPGHASIAVTRVIAGLLYAVGPLDPLVFVSVSALLAGAGVVATLIPARRATKVDPIIALRIE